MHRRTINFLDTAAEEEAESPLAEEEESGGKIVQPKRWVLFLFISLCVLGIGGFAVAKMLPGDTGINDPAGYDPVTLEPKPPEGLLKRITRFVFHKEQKLAGEKDDRINILLLGMGGPGHDGPYLTDTIMIVSIKPSTNEVAMISIPRDLGVKIPGHGWQKINSANAYGEADKPLWGGAFATEVIEETFDIDIQYYVRVDFTAFKELVDEVGGVTINVERAFTDVEFPAANDEYQTVSFQKGAQKMDGEKALQYSRSRHGSNGEGSDYARAARQQKVILALKEKMLSLETLTNPVRISTMIKTLDTHVTTNMEFSEIIEFIKMARAIDVGGSIRLVLDTSPNGFLRNASTGGAFIVEPKTGNFDAINKAIEHIFEETPESGTEVAAEEGQEAALPEATVEIQNGTWQAGMASRIRKRVEEAGLLVGTVGNTVLRPQEKSGIYLISRNHPDPVTKKLGELLHIPIISSAPPEGEVVAPNTDILVILGEDFSE